MSETLKYCNERKLAVVPQSGRTSQVGGSVALHDEIVLNMSLMDKILGFDTTYGIISAQGGAILKSLQDYSEERGYQLPCDFVARDKCMIGGSLANNAAGYKLMGEGSFHSNAVGMKAVLADGTILDNMTTLRKDVSGYDVKHLFIGSKGTLGIITECSILCKPAFKNRHVALIAVSSLDQVSEVINQAKLCMEDIIQSL